MRLFAVLLGALVMFTATTSAALDPARSLRQYQETSWTLKEGAPPDIWALAQTQDGYLWLGTGAGLYRYDGVRFQPMGSATTGELPGDNIVSLLAAPSGDLWIGYYAGGVSLLQQGRFRHFSPVTDCLRAS